MNSQLINGQSIGKLNIQTQLVSHIAMLGRVLGAADPNFLTMFSGRTSQYLSTREGKGS
jgi:hypothetical protein